MKKLLKIIWWYHINPYSNYGTKGLLSIIMISAFSSAILGAEFPKIYHGNLFFGFISYILLLCDRGFGEPDCEEI